MQLTLTTILLAVLLLASCAKKETGIMVPVAKDSILEPNTKLMISFDGHTSINTDKKRVYAIKNDQNVSVIGTNNTIEKFQLEIGGSEVGEYQVTSESTGPNARSGHVQENKILYTTYYNSEEFSKGAKIAPRGSIRIIKSTPNYIEGKYNLMVIKNSDGKKSLPRPLDGSFIAYYKK